MQPTEGIIERATIPYKNLGERFVQDTGAFERQYFYVYQQRLSVLRPLLIAAARAKWGAELPIRKTGELVIGEESIVVGVIVKHQPLRPSMLKAIAAGVNEVPQPCYQKYTSEEDTIGLEDDLQPIRIHGNSDLENLITGVVVALKGAESQGDNFRVDEFIFPPPPPAPKLTPLTGDTFVLLVSGLEFSGPESADAEAGISYEALIDWLGEDETAARVARVVVAGNLISRDPESRNLTQLVRKLTQRRKHLSPSVACVKTADRFLAKLTALVPVDLMPGANDPTSWMLPQQPLHPSLFPEVTAVGASGNLHLVSNPLDAEMGGRRILGTSGQNIDDVYRYSTQSEPLELLEATFRFQHLAPTAPDTLGCFPLTAADPFLVAQDPAAQPCPALYFAGNQAAFAHKRIVSEDGAETELVVIPSFRQTSSVVLVNLRTMDARVQSFARNKADIWE